MPPVYEHLIPSQYLRGSQNGGSSAKEPEIVTLFPSENQGTPSPPKKKEPEIVTLSPSENEKPPQIGSNTLLKADWAHTGKKVRQIN